MLHVQKKIRIKEVETNGKGKKSKQTCLSLLPPGADWPTYGYMLHCPGS